eukprot:scaffold1302_cov165-Ochromonas_danica.AAC.3
MGKGPDFRISGFLGGWARMFIQSTILSTSTKEEHKFPQVSIMRVAEERSLDRGQFKEGP